MGVPEIKEPEHTRFNFNFVGNRKIGYAVSGISFVMSLIALYFLGLNYGVEFTGGSVFHYRFKGEVHADQIRTALSTSTFKELGDVQVQRVMGGLEATGVTTGSEYILRSKFEETVAQAGVEDIEVKMDKVLSILGNGCERLSVEKIGPTVGASLKVKAFWSAFLGCLTILLYIAVRFEFRPPSQRLSPRCMTAS